MINIKKFWLGLRIFPVSSSSIDAKGEMEVLDASGKLNYHNGTSKSPMVTEAHSATLTNKTFDAAGTGNTLSNVANANIASNAAIADTKLATISTAGKVSNSATTAASANTASAIVARDASGNFSAGTITATFSGNLTGNVTGNTSGSAASFTGSLSGDVTGTQSATVVSTIAGSSASTVATGALKANSATDSKTLDAIVKRNNTDGGFSAGPINAESLNSNTSISGQSLTLTLTPLAISSGGTGSSTAQAARNALLPSQSSNSGKFLTSDGTNVSWASAPASQWTTSSSDIYYTTGNVGIGTTSPGAKVEIKGATNGGTQELFKAYAYDTDSFFSLQNDASNSLDLKLTKSDGTTNFFIDGHQGKVGIGTTSPGATLAVKNSGGVVAAIFNSSSGTTDANSGLRIASGSSTSHYNWLIGNQYNVTGAFEITPSTTTGGTTFSTPAMVIDSSGNVGIGTTSPSTYGQFTAFNTGNITMALVSTGSSPVFQMQCAATGFCDINFGKSGALAEGKIRYSDNANSMGFYTNSSASAQMFIDSSGNVGIGTTSPTAGSKLHIQNNSTSSSYAVIENTSTSGNTANAGWSFAAYDGSAQSTIGYLFGTANSWGFGAYGSKSMNLVGAGSGGTNIMSTNASGVIKFFTGGEVSGNERMRIDSSGYVGIGTTSPSTMGAVLSIAGGGGGAGQISLTDGANGGAIQAFTSQAATTRTGYLSLGPSFLAANAGDVALGLASTGSASKKVVIQNRTNGVYVADGGTSWTSNSDERIKDIIEPISDGLNKVSSLRAVIGKYKADPDGTRRAFIIAQDVQKALPEAVVEDNGILGVQYTDLIPLLISSVKELKAELDSVKAELAALKG